MRAYLSLWLQHCLCIFCLHITFFSYDSRNTFLIAYYVVLGNHAYINEHCPLFCCLPLAIIMPGYFYCLNFHYCLSMLLSSLNSMYHKDLPFSVVIFGFIHHEFRRCFRYRLYGMYHTTLCIVWYACATVAYIYVDFIAIRLYEFTGTFSSLYVEHLAI